METSQPLSIESFSYSWLVNFKPSLESLGDSFRASIDASDEASFIEMDPKLPPSKRFFRGSQDFNFDFPMSESPLTLVHADEIISNGFLMPLFVKQLGVEDYDATSDSIPSTPTSSHAPKKVDAAGKVRCSSLRWYRRLSKQIFQKYLKFLRPLCQQRHGRKSGSSSGNINAGMQDARDWEYSSEASPRASVAYSADTWRRSFDSDSSIYEAILHCKRTIGK